MGFAVFIASIMVVLITIYLNQRSNNGQSGIIAELFDRAKNSLTLRRNNNSAQAQLSPEEAQLKSKYRSLNIFLYIGSFIFISAVTAYLSSIDTMLVPPTVITITLLTALASILMYKYVNFLKPAAIAFNISALIMFLFWWPSLDAYDISVASSSLIIFASITFVSLISAIIFNDSKYWHCVFAFFGFLITSIIAFFEDLDDGLKIEPALLILTIIFSLLSSLLIYLWKSKALFVPQSMRRSVMNFAFIYQIVPLVMIPSLLAASHFSATTAICFLFFNYVFSKFIGKEKASIPVLRALAQVAAIVISIDICATCDPYRDQTNVISVVVLASSLIQCIISGIMMVANKDEHSRTLERSIICLSAVASSFVAYKYFDNVMEWVGSYSSFDLTLGGIALTLCSLVGIAMFFLDKSSLWLSPTVLFIVSFFNLRSSDAGLAPIFIIAFSVLCFLAPFIYFTNHKKDKQEALFGVVGLLLALCLSNFMIQASIDQQNAFFLIPTGMSLISLMILACITNELAIIKLMFYQLAIMLLHTAATFEKNTSVMLSFLAAEAIPIAMLAHGSLNTISKKETTPNALLITAYVLFELIYFPNMVDTSYENGGLAVVALVGVLVNLGVLIVGMMRKWKVLQGFAIATILLQLLSITGSNTALWFIILGLVIIVAVIIGFYRLANKENNQTPAQPQDPNQNQPQA